MVTKLKTKSWLDYSVKLLGRPSVRALIALSLILTIGMVFHADGSFYKWTTHRDTLRQSSVYGILACGLTIVIISGGIDLAVGSILGLTAVVFAFLTIHLQWPAALAIPACLSIGALCGSMMGLLIARFSIQPFIATLAMMVFARGLAKHVSGGKKISQYIQMPEGGFETVDLPRIFTVIDNRILGGNLAVVTLVFLACLIIVWLLLAHTKTGRYFYAIGGGEEAARLSGVPVRWIKTLAYALSGFFGAVAGICQAAQETQGDPEAGSGYELSAIAIVVIGGTALTGGQGGAVLTLLGTLTIGYLEKILSINAVGESSRLMLTGAIIIGAVLFQRIRKHL